jgi:hypothetical protein
VRVVKQAVSAGVEADPRSLQIWASWGYREISARHGQYMLANRGASLDEIADARAEIIRQVLKEIAFLAMELTDVTSTNEDRLLDEPEASRSTSSRGTTHRPRAPGSLRTTLRRSSLQSRSAGPFAAELKTICSKISRPTPLASSITKKRSSNLT